MQHIFRGLNDDYGSTFRAALIEILREGHEVKPRGMLTKEIPQATMIIDPRKSLYFSPLRNLNFAFLFAENLWYLSGRSDTHFLSFYNSKIKSFSEDGLHDGNYGTKIISQIRYVIDTLKKDPDSRQAVINLWRDNPRPSKDVPCTLNFIFSIRNNKLNMHVQMRSNDIIWGSNYDVPSFSLIQMVIASCLSIQPGTLYHTANSLHLYDTHFDMAEKLCVEEIEMKRELFTCTDMSLEEHSQQWDILSSIESSMRNLKIHELDVVEYTKNKLDIFYQQYAYVFLWFHAMKKKDSTAMQIAWQNLDSIKSPVADWYKIKTIDCKNSWKK